MQIFMRGAILRVPCGFFVSQCTLQLFEHGGHVSLGTQVTLALLL